MVRQRCVQTFPVSFSIIPNRSRKGCIMGNFNSHVISQWSLVSSGAPTEISVIDKWSLAKNWSITVVDVGVVADVGDDCLTFRWCLKVTETYNCNFKPRKGVHTTKLVRNYILHLIVGFFINFYFFSKSPLAAILDFCCLHRNSTHGDIWESSIWLSRDSQVKFQLWHPNV